MINNKIILYMLVFTIIIKSISQDIFMDIYMNYNISYNFMILITRISTSFAVISNDLAMIIHNSSKKLHLLLKSCLIPTDPTFARVNKELPILKYNEKFLE